MGNPEKRVVTKAVLATRRVQNFTVPITLSNDGLWIIRVANQYQNADKVGCPVCFTRHCFDQMRIVTRI